LKDRRVWVLATIIIISFTLSSALTVCLAQDSSNLSYKFANQADGNISCTLNVGIPKSLDDYYVGLSHRSYKDSDFPKFVTPYSVQPIADALRQIYPGDEDFANGVLSLVHQIPYEETIDQFYPVETLLRNKGDCDMFSLLAASILKAGGLDVTLLHYVSEEHMNVGIHLSQEPVSAKQDVYSVNAQNVTYYIAECTGTSWRTGECPPDLQNASPIVVPLNNSEKTAPGQVTASFKQLDPTAISLSVSPAFAFEGTLITIEGQISPSLPNENVTIYSSASGADWTVLATTKTQSEGKFSYAWKSSSIGQVNLRAGWAGNDLFAGTASQSKTTLVLPLYLAASVAAAFVAIVICVGAVVAKRRKRKLPALETEFTSEATLPLI
jgi:hypothetical protein